MRRYLISLIVALGFAAGPVGAEGPVGIAFVQAPEQSSAACFGDNLDRAFACARTECAGRDGVTARDCLRTTWCYPSRWSANLFLQHKEGIHWQEVLCGWESREDLMAAVKARCEGSARQWLRECTIVRSWDNGRAQDLSYSLATQ